MKILQIISGVEVNGALMHCKLLSQELARNGHDVTLMCRRDSWIWDQVDQDLVRVVASEMNRWPLGQLFAAARWIRSEQFDVMHTHMSRAHTYGILMKHLSGVPVVATAHNRHIQVHWCLNDYVIANSEATRSFHCRYNGVPRRKVETIHCFIDRSRFDGVSDIMRKQIRERWRISQQAPVIGIVGAVTKRKGHWYLFQALPQLLERFPDLRLVIVGGFDRQDPYVQKLRAFQKKHQLIGKIKWWGARKHIQNVMQGLDALVVPSLEEPMGMVPLEAMATGTPVIASKTGGLVEVIQHQENGLLIPRRDSEAIVQAVSRVLEDQDLRQQLITSGFRWVNDQFSSETLSGRVEQALLSTSRRGLRAA